MVGVERRGYALAQEPASGRLKQLSKKLRNSTDLTPPVNAVFTDIAVLLAMLKEHVTPMVCAPAETQDTTPIFWVSLR